MVTPNNNNNNAAAPFAGLVSVGAVRKAIGSNPKLSFYLTVLDDMTFQNKITGEIYSNLEEAFQQSTLYGLVQARRFGAIAAGQEATILDKGVGAPFLEGLTDYLNEYLETPSSAADLQRIGLGNLAGKKLRGQYTLFKWDKDEEILSRLMLDLEQGTGYFKDFPGFLNLTDEGLQVFSLSYLDGNEFTPLSAHQQSLLRTAAGVPAYSPSAIKKFLGSEDKAAGVLSKIPKRTKSEIAPRDMGFERINFEGIIDDKNFAYVFDPTEALLQTASGGVVTDPYARFMLASTGGRVRYRSAGLSNMRRMRRYTLTQDEAMEEVFRLARLIDPTGAPVNPAQAEIDMLKAEVRTALDQSRRNLEAYNSSVPQSQRKSMLEALDEYVANNQNTLDPKVKGILGHLEKNLETIQDGQYSISRNALDRVLRQYSDQKNTIMQQVSSGQMSADDAKNIIAELDSNIERTQHLIDAGTGYRTPVRAGGGYKDPITGKFKSGQFKGDAGVKSFGDMISSLERKVLKGDRDRVEREIKNVQTRISKATSAKDAAEVSRQQRILSELQTYLSDIDFDISTINEAEKIQKNSLIQAAIANVKSEVGNPKIPFLAANVSMKNDNSVFIEPQRLMADPLSYTDPQFIARQRAAVAAEKAKLDRFMLTGELPEDFKQGLIKEAEAFGILGPKQGTFHGIPVAQLGSAERAEFIKQKQQVQVMIDALLSNRDPRGVPELVNRLHNSLMSGIIREKDGVISLINPDALRFKLTTYEVNAQRQIGAALGGYQTVGVSQAVQAKATAIAGGQARTRGIFVDFTIQGKQMYVSGHIASAYKAALGTFDLDDSGIPILKTFTDDKGKRRIAFTTVRDPSSIEEQIFKRMSMNHAETIKAMFGDDAAGLQFFEKTFDENQAIIAQYIDQSDMAEAEQVYKKMRQILEVGGEKLKASEKSNLKALFTSGSESFIAEQLFLAGKERLGTVTSLDENQYFIEAVARVSASTRGRDARNLATGLSEQVARNLSAEKGAPYLEDAFIEISTNPNTAGVHSKFMDVLRGMDPSYQQLTDISQVIANYDPDNPAAIKFVGDVNKAFEDLVTQTGFKLTTEMKIENTVGSLINRTNSSYSVMAQMRSFADNQLMSQVVSDSKKMSEFLGQRYGAGIVPASDVVDIVKQMIGGLALEDYNEVIAGKSTAEVGKITAAYESIKEVMEGRGVTGVTLDNLHAQGLLPSDVAAATFRQNYKNFGYRYGLQALSGVDESERLGIDPSVITDRIKSKAASDDLKNSILAGLRDLQNDIMDGSQIDGLDMNEARNRIDALNQEIARLEGLGGKNNIDFKQAISLKQGTAAYNRYAATDLQKTLAQTEYNSFEASKNLTKTGVFGAEEVLSAPVEARRYAEALIDTSGISTLVDRLNAIGYANTDYTKLLDSIFSNEIGSRINAGFMAIKDQYQSQGGNVLDMIDALELEMTNKFGSRAKRFLGFPGGKGQEDVVMTLFDLAKRRRLDKESIRNNRAASDAIQDLLRQFTQDSTANIEDVTADWARNYLNQLEAARPTLAPNFDDAFGQLTDFMTRTVGRSTIGTKEERAAAITPADTQAAKAASYQEALARLRQIDADAAAAVSSAGANSSQASQVDQRLLDGINQILDDDILDDYGNTRVARSNYKRFKFGEFISNKNVRNSLIAGGLLIAGSFIYQSKKDRTASDITGPPLLPGGNPYETGYPTRQSVIDQINQPNAYPVSYDYKINTSGSMNDLNRLNSLVGGVVDGPTNTTMYNGLPRMGRDPYSDVASRF